MDFRQRGEEVKNFFEQCESKLRKRAPKEIAEAVSLAGKVCDPRTCTASQCWDAMWDKPLYANNRNDVADRKAAIIRPMMRGKWRTIGAPRSEFVVTKIPSRKGLRAFHVDGSLALGLHRVQRIPAHRLFAIQGAAVALRKRWRSNRSTPLSDLVAQPLREQIKTLRVEMGPYWGNITVLHLLTDLGLACKPDLVRTVRALGIVDSAVDCRVPTLDQSVEINEAVRALATDLYGEVTSSHLRYLDKVLMAISERGILDEHEPESPVAHAVPGATASSATGSLCR